MQIPLTLNSRQLKFVRRGWDRQNTKSEVGAKERKELQLEAEYYSLQERVEVKSETFGVHKIVTD